MKKSRNYLSIVMVAMWVLLAILPLFRVWNVNFDEILFDYIPWKDLFGVIWKFTVLNQARASFFQPISAVISHIDIVPYGFWCAGYVVLLGVGMYLLLYAITFEKTWGGIGALLAVGWYTITLEPISIPTGNAFTLGWCAVAATLGGTAFACLFYRTEKYRYKVFSIVCVLCAIFSYEVSVLYLPVIIGLNLCLQRPKSIRRFFRSTWEYFACGFLYVGCFAAVKIFLGPGGYSGTQIGEVDLGRTVLCYLINFVTSLPGYSFFWKNSGAYQPAYCYANGSWGDFGLVLKNLFTLRSVLCIVGFGILFWRWFRRVPERRIQNIETYPKWFEKGFAFFLGIYALVIPTLPSCLSEYTQDQIQAGWRTTLIGNQYAYCVLIVLSVLALYWLRRHLKATEKVCSVALVVLLMGVNLIVCVNNDLLSGEIENLSCRFQILEKTMPSLLENVPDKSTVYTPSLSKVASTLSFPSGTLDKMARYYTGKNIRFVDVLPEQDTEEPAAWYYLNYLQNDVENVLMVLGQTSLSELQKYESYQYASTQLEVSNPVVYVRSSDDSFRLFGRKENAGEYGWNAGKSSGSGVAYEKVVSIDLVQDSMTHVGDLSKVELIGETFDANSFVVMPHYRNPDGSVVRQDLNAADVRLLRGNNLWTDHWVGPEAELRVEGVYPGQQVRLSVRALPESEIPPDTRVSVYVNGSYQTNVPLSKNGETIDILIPSTIDGDLEIKLRTDFSFPSEDGRSLSYFLDAVSLINEDQELVLF